VGNLLVSGNNQRMGRATGPVMWSKEFRRRTAMPDFVMSVVSSTVGLPVRFDRCSDPEGAIVGDGYPLLSVIRLFTPGSHGTRSIAVHRCGGRAVGAVVMRLGGRYPHASPGPSGQT
jgi:hypothetical protein